MTPFKWSKCLFIHIKGTSIFLNTDYRPYAYFSINKIWSKQWFPLMKIFLLSSTLNINNFLYNGTNWFKFSTFFCLQLPSLYLIAKKKKGKKEKSGCFSWMLCTLLSGLSDFQLDLRGRNQGFYNVVCQRMFLFCKRPGLDHILFHDFKIGHLREILIYGLP